MEMGRNTGFGKKGFNSGTPDVSYKVLSTKYSMEPPYKFNFPI
jgi:hypothetical protein